MKVLIVDDEPLARARLKRLLEGLDIYKIIGEAGSGKEALETFHNEQPDIVLMDIRMPEMDGLEAARHLSQEASPPAVIFTTAYNDHALEAFQAKAVDYLLKPVRKERLEEALQQAQKLTKAQLAKLEQKPSRREFICAKVRNNLELVPVDKIYYFQADKKYITVKHGEGDLLIEESLKQLETEFGDDFIRIHRNALIAKKYIQKLEKTMDGRFLVILMDINESLEVSRRHVVSLRSFLRQF